MRDLLEAGDDHEDILDRILARYRRTPLGRHPRVTGATAIALLAAAGLAGARLAGPASSPEPLRPSSLTALSIVTTESVGPPSATRIVARYQPSDSRVRIRGVLGPYLAGTQVTAGTAAGDDITVTARPDCRDGASLRASSATYQLAISRVGADGRSFRGTAPASSAPVNWGSAVEQYCWREQAAAGLTVDGVTATADRHRRQLVLNVTLHSRLGTDVSVHVVDIANVDTIAAADSGTLSAGGARALQVRLPLTGCTPPQVPLDAGPPGLTWSVGPVAGDPAAVVTTALSQAQVATIDAVARRACAPPSNTLIRVIHAASVPSSSVVHDPTAVVIDVRLEVRSVASKLILGTDVSGLTSDAQVDFKGVDVRPSEGVTTATVRWHASCLLDPPAVADLPVTLINAAGTARSASVRLDAPALGRVYAAACHLREGSGVSPAS